MPKILLAILGVLVLALGAWWYVATRPAAPAQPATLPGGSLPNVGINQSVAVTPVPTVTQTPPLAQGAPSQSLIDFDAAYAALYEKLGATIPTYMRINASSTGEAAAIYALYKKDVSIAKELSPNGDASIEVAMQDLNNDGTAEALVYEDLPDFCGTGGCTLDMYQKRSGAWVKLFSALVENDRVGVSNTLTEGYLNLYLSVHSAQADSGAGGGVVRYDWDGTGYKPKLTVARWDGSKFTPLY